MKMKKLVASIVAGALALSSLSLAMWAASEGSEPIKISLSENVFKAADDSGAVPSTSNSITIPTGTLTLGDIKKVVATLETDSDYYNGVMGANIDGTWTASEQMEKNDSGKWEWEPEGTLTSAPAVQIYWINPPAGTEGGGTVTILSVEFYGASDVLLAVAEVDDSFEKVDIPFDKTSYKLKVETVTGWTPSGYTKTAKVDVPIEVDGVEFDTTTYAELKKTVFKITGIDFSEYDLPEGVEASDINVMLYSKWEVNGTKWQWCSQNTSSLDLSAAKVNDEVIPDDAIIQELGYQIVINGNKGGIDDMEDDEAVVLQLKEEEPEETTEATTEPETTTEPTTEPEATTEPTTEPEATTEPTTEPEATTEPTTEPEATTEPTTEPETTTEPITEPETTTEPTTEPETTTEPTTEPETTTEPTTEPETTTEPTTEPETTTEPTTEPEVTTEATTAPEPAESSAPEESKPEETDPGAENVIAQGEHTFAKSEWGDYTEGTIVTIAASKLSSVDDYIIVEITPKQAENSSAWKIGLIPQPAGGSQWNLNYSEDAYALKLKAKVSDILAVLDLTAITDIDSIVVQVWGPAVGDVIDYTISIESAGGNEDPDITEPEETEPEETKPGEIDTPVIMDPIEINPPAATTPAESEAEPEETQPEESKPDATEPDESKPNEPGVTEPDVVIPGKSEIIEGSDNGEAEASKDTAVKIEIPELKVTLEANAGTFEEAVTKIIAEVNVMLADASAKDKATIIAAAIKGLANASESVSVNDVISIVLKDQDGNIIQPVAGASVKVTVPYDGKSNYVAYIDGEDVEFIKLTISGDYASFEAKHFSDYYLVTLSDEAVKSVEGSAAGNTDSSTGDKNQPTGFVIALIPAAASAAMVVISKKRKK